MGQFILAAENLSQAVESVLRDSKAAGLATAMTARQDGLMIALSRRVDGSGPDWAEDAAPRHFTVGTRSDQGRGAFVEGDLHQGRWHLRTDRAGAMQMFYLPQGRVAASSFLACAKLAGQRTLDPQACFEYAWNGTTFGERTLFEEIRRVNPDHELHADALGIRAVERPPPARGPLAHEIMSPPPDLDPARIAKDEIDKLLHAFHDLAPLFADGVRSALSGGYDSRLLLALLLELGIKPHLFVYGQEMEPDVLVARRIADEFGLDLEHRRRDDGTLRQAEEFEARIERDLVAVDGLPDEGVFGRGSDYSDRATRHQGAVVLNGGLGEIYRNFFYLPDRPLRPDDLISSFFARFDRRAMTTAFSETDFRQALKIRFAEALGKNDPGDVLSRAEVEALYPLVRGRDWTAREISISQRFGAFLAPFMDAGIIAGTPCIPIHLKTHGRLEGRMIARLNPQLAAVPGSGGHALDGNPPLRYRIGHLGSLYRPLWMRRSSYRLQRRLQSGGPRPDYLSHENLARVLDIDFPYMRRLFRLERVTDWAVFNRIATMELLAQRLNARWPD